MRLMLGLFLFTLGVSLFPQASVSQPMPEKELFSMRNRIFFDYFFMYNRELNDSLYQMEIDYQIPISFLKFFLDDSLYQSRYEIRLVLYKDERFIWDRVWEKQIMEKQYENTMQSNFYCLDKVDFEVDSGKYQCQIQLYDTHSKNQFEHTIRFELPPIKGNGELVSSFKFGYQTILDSDSVRKMLPNISRIYEEKEPLLYIDYILSGKMEIDSIYYLIEVMKDDNVKEEILNRSFLLLKDRPLTSHIVDSIRLVKFPQAKYNFQLIVGSRAGSIRREKVFIIGGQSILPSISFKDHLRLLSLIAKGDEMSRLKKAKEEGLTDQEALDKFWKERDPNPQTEENEERDEFYKRVFFAIQNFSVGRFKPGWDTDRGRVYISLGTPDNVERYDYNMQGKPYQIWYYYRQNRQYVFVDYSGFGDYELIPGSGLDYY